MTEGCGPHCPCWRNVGDWVPYWPGEWGYCDRDVDKYEDGAGYFLAGDLSRTKEQELENE